MKRRIFLVVFVSHLLLGFFLSSPLEWSLTGVVVAGLEYSTLQYHYGIIIAFPFPTNNSALFTTALAWPSQCKSEKDKRTFMIMVIRLHFLCCQQLFES
jgi:hypothetical protein